VSAGVAQVELQSRLSRHVRTGSSRQRRLENECGVMDAIFGLY